ncbi:MAG: 6-phosphofructokinase [Christensenellales bacterium]|jgi:6-phosphofructokinase 1
MRQIGVLTSGGDTPGMNAVIRAVVKSGIQYGLQVYGVFSGYKGLINGDMRLMTEADVTNIVHKGGTILKTARSDEFRTPEGAKKAMLALRAFGIDGLVIIGGDGSLAGAQLLADMGCKVMGIPGTIDNDLAYTQFTIGFDTAINNVVEQVYKIRDTMTSHDRIGVIEVMGRNCGDIALYSAVASGAHALLLPEVPYDFEKLCDGLVANKIRGKRSSIVIMAEGVGDAEEMAQRITEATGHEARSIVLGYTQRGGNPTAADRILATRCGVHAVELLKNGVANRAIGIRENKIIDIEIAEALKAPYEFDYKLHEISTIVSMI